MGIRLALLPALVLAWMSGFAGTFQAPLEPFWCFAGYGAVLLFAVLGSHRIEDPLGLGRAGAVFTWGLVALVIALAWYGPFPRAGRVAAILLPAWILIPAAVSYCLPGPRALYRGRIAVTLVAVGGAVWALDGWLRLGTPGTSLPLGHHNLLAAWLLVLWPIAASLPADRRWRWLKRGSVGLLLAALIATRSLAGLAALAVQVGWWFARSDGEVRDRRRWRVAGVLVLLAMASAPRLLDVARGEDVSWNARRAYAEAGWDGILERPAFGWGPGSVPWTIGQWLEPRPGILPAGEVIGHLHTLPLDLLYELGIVGTLGVVLLMGLFRRCRTRQPPLDADLKRATSTSWIGLFVISLGGLPLTVLALPMVIAVLAGLELANRSQTPRSVSSPLSLALWLYIPLALALLWPVVRAQDAYDRARHTDDGAERRANLWLAAHLDPQLPLYPARLAWTLGLIEEDAPERALRAAKQAQGIAELWLEAGILGRNFQRPWAEEALERACALDPHGAIAPFVLAVAYTEERELGPQRAARALLAEPRLAAAVNWHQRPWMSRRALQFIEERPEIDDTWRQSFLEVMSDTLAADKARRRLALRVDYRASTSFSLFAFRRTPWPVQPIEVEVWERGIQAVGELDSAIASGKVEAKLLNAPRCGLAVD